MLKNIANISKGYHGYRSGWRCLSSVKSEIKVPESADVVIIGKTFSNRIVMIHVDIRSKKLNYFQRSSKCIILNNPTLIFVYS